MAKQFIRVVKSPWLADYEDKDNAPPWDYDFGHFKDWVYEVLLDMGRAGRYPRNVDEAMDIAEGANFVVKVIDSTPMKKRKR